MKKRSTTTVPSGEVLPLYLRKKYNDQIDRAGQGGEDQSKKKLPLQPKVDKGDVNQVFTAEELEHKMIQASYVMMEIQKQLYRGEEVYMEDTHTHGNLFRGWDAFIDLKDVGSNAGGGAAAQPGATRRIPADNRWFSGSCKSVARSFSRPMSRMSTSRTPTPSIARSLPATPVPMAPSPQPVLSEASSVVVKAPQQDAAVSTAVTTRPSQADATPLRPSALAQTKTETAAEQTMTEEQVAVKAEEPAAATPTAATPLRRNSSRKRKQGETI